MMARKAPKRRALRIRLKKTLVAAGLERLVSRRVIRGIFIILNLERV